MTQSVGVSPEPFETISQREAEYLASEGIHPLVTRYVTPGESGIRRIYNSAQTPRIIRLLREKGLR